MTVGDTIMKGLNVIREKGLCAGTRHSPQGRVCALGAVEDALHIYDYAEDNLQFVETVQALARYLPPPGKWMDRVPPMMRPHLRPSEDFQNNEVLVALYSNTHSQLEVEEWFLKAAHNEGMTV